MTTPFPRKVSVVQTLVCVDGKPSSRHLYLIDYCPVQSVPSFQKSSGETTVCNHSYESR